MATSTAYIFGTKNDIRNRTSNMEPTKVSYIISKCMNFGEQMA